MIGAAGPPPPPPPRPPPKPPPPRAAAGGRPVGPHPVVRRYPLEAQILDRGRVDQFQRAEALAGEVAGVAGPLIRQRLHDVRRIEAAASASAGGGQSAASGPSSPGVRVCRRGNPGRRSARARAPSRRRAPGRGDMLRHVLHVCMGLAPLLDRPQIRGDVVHLLVLGVVELQHHRLVRVLRILDVDLRARRWCAPSTCACRRAASGRRASRPCAPACLRASSRRPASRSPDCRRRRRRPSAAAAERPRSIPRPTRSGARAHPRTSTPMPLRSPVTEWHVEQAAPKYGFAGLGVADEHVQLDARSGSVRAGCPGRSSWRECCGCIPRSRRCRPATRVSAGVCFATHAPISSPC